MVTQRSTVAGLLALAALPLALVAACDKVPLLAPTGSVITLLVGTTSASLNSEVTVIATVIENGQASGGGSGAGNTTRTGAGTPVQNGTLITFTTTIGRIEPADARTHNGQVTVKLLTGSTSGTATITAYSGGASASVNTLKIGTAAVKTVSVTTTPQSLGAAGGTTQVVASVVDEGGSPLGGVPITFSTDKGSITPSTATTDAGGIATATLNTTATAKITATVGTLTGTSTVTVNTRAMASFTASAGSANAGVPITFTVALTAGANVLNVRIAFGDGNSTDLGPIGAQSNASYAYPRSGVYTATATALDATGDTQSLSTQLLIGSLPVTISVNTASPTVNSNVTFAAGGIPATVQVDHYTWTFDDGQGPFNTTSPSFSRQFTTPGPKTVRVDVVGVGGGIIGTAQLPFNVQ